jgi:hypothetical protein
MAKKRAVIGAWLRVIEKSIFFRSLAPLTFIGALGLYVYSRIQYEALLSEYTEAAIFDVINGTRFLELANSRITSEIYLVQYLQQGSTIALVISGLVLHVWAAWVVGNLAFRKGFSKRSYFWLSLAIGPVIPLVVSFVSKPNSPIHESFSKNREIPELSYISQDALPERDEDGRIIVRLRQERGTIRMEGPSFEFFDLEAPKRVRMYFESEGDNRGVSVPEITFYSPKPDAIDFERLREMQDFIRAKTGAHRFVWDVYLDEEGLHICDLAGLDIRAASSPDQT